MLKYVALFITLSYSAALLTVSLLTLKDLPNIGVSYADKIFHCCAYFILGVLWFITFAFNFKIPARTSMVYAAILSITFGIIIEVLQDVMTVSRALDVYDMLANTVGVLLAIGLCYFKYGKNVKKA